MQFISYDYMQWLYVEQLYTLHILTSASKFFKEYSQHL